MIWFIALFPAIFCLTISAITYNLQKHTAKKEITNG